MHPIFLGQICASLDETYFAKRPRLIAMSQYIAEMLENQRSQQAPKIKIIAGRIQNEGLGG